MFTDQKDEIENSAAGSDRRAFLAQCGKFAATVPPAMTVLMSTSLVSPAIAMSAGNGGNGGNNPSGCNNGVGNGPDCAPPGNPPVNDDHPGNTPGNPGNQGGQH